MFWLKVPAVTVLLSHFLVDVVVSFGVADDDVSECIGAGACIASSLLQVDVASLPRQAPLRSGAHSSFDQMASNGSRAGLGILQQSQKPKEGVEKIFEKVEMSAFVKVLEKVSKIILGLVLLCTLGAFVFLMLSGLPAKAPQHPEVKGGMSTSWAVYLGVVYAFFYFTTDQYVPSLPQMAADLSGSQAAMSGTVQMNICVKAIIGLFAASMSDRVGRKPILLTCLVMLSMASFCCACASRVEWFFAARFLQAMGESAEPVILAMVRDYFTNPDERFAVISGLGIIAFAGPTLAPLYGGMCAYLFTWRASFFGLSVAWGLLAIYGFRNMVESCPDGQGQSYLQDLSKILDRHLLILLLTDVCVQGAYFTFNANCTYLTEVSFGQSELVSSLIMVAFGALGGCGAIAVQQFQTRAVLTTARLGMTLLIFAGLVSLLLGVIVPETLWGYLVGSFLQASVMMMANATTNVLFFEPLEDCAGLAASCEVVAQSVFPSLYSAMATRSMINHGPQALSLLQGAACVVGGLVFWVGYGSNPPAWTLEAFDEEDQPKTTRTRSIRRLASFPSW